MKDKMEKKNEIRIITQGILGGKISIPKRVGWLRVKLREGFGSSDSIVIDGYYGAGISYAKRDQPNIKVEWNDKVIFEGTYNQMCECLKFGNEVKNYKK
jgi:hypothetical protein